MYNACMEAGSPSIHKPLPGSLPDLDLRYGSPCLMAGVFVGETEPASRACETFNAP